MDLSLATPELKPRCFEIQSLTSSSTKLGTKVTLLLPIQKIDKDEGYSPSPGSISNFCDQNSLFLLQSFLDPRVSSLVSAFFSSQVSLCPPHFLSCLPQQDCVWLEFPSPWSGPEALPMGSLPHPSLTLEEAFPPTSLTGIHSWSEGCSDLSKLIPAWYWFGGG
jgi:hypothetical protein